MKHSTLMRVLPFAVLIGCTSDEPIGPDGQIDYQGTWVGDIGDPTTILRTPITWTPTHSRNAVEGNITFQLTATLTARGKLTANVVGAVLEFTLNVPAGAYPSPVSPACTLTGTGISSTATATSIVAVLTLTYTAPCLGTVTTVSTVTHRITLAKVE